MDPSDAGAGVGKCDGPGRITSDLVCCGFDPVWPTFVLFASGAVSDEAAFLFLVSVKNKGIKTQELVNRTNGPEITPCTYSAWKSGCL